MFFGGDFVYVLPKTRAIICPLCRAPLSVCGASLVCEGGRRHTFDIARTGYVNLNLHSSASGDTKEMADARRQFLRQGYYTPLCEALSEAVGKGALLCDAGCGEGYYTERAAQGFDFTVGADLSKYALAFAGKSARRALWAERLLYVAASVYALPIADNACDCVLNVFAPCAAEEFFRVLRPGGRLVIAAAGRDHLLEMKRFLYDEVVPNEERRDYPKEMTLLEKFPVRRRAEIPGDALRTLFQMTPYFYRTKKDRADALGALSSLPLTLDFEIRIYIKEV